MLSVYPDLLGDQAPPPAPPVMIESLPIVKIHGEQGMHMYKSFIICRFFHIYIIDNAKRNGFILSVMYLTLDLDSTIQKFPSSKSYQTLHLPCHSESDHFPKVILVATFGKNVRPLGNRCELFSSCPFHLQYSNHNHGFDIQCPSYR